MNLYIDSVHVYCLFVRVSHRWWINAYDTVSTSLGTLEKLLANAENHTIFNAKMLANVDNEPHNFSKKCVVLTSNTIHLHISRWPMKHFIGPFTQN